MFRMHEALVRSQHHIHQTQWCIPVVLGLERCRKEDQKFKVIKVILRASELEAA